MARKRNEYAKWQVASDLHHWNQLMRWEYRSARRSSFLAVSLRGRGTGDSPRVDAAHEHHQGGRCWFYSTELTGARGSVFTIPGTASLGGCSNLGL